jgi:hypothetical protein
MRDSDLHPSHQKKEPVRSNGKDQTKDKLRLFEVLDVEKIFGQIVFARNMLTYVLLLFMTGWASDTDCGIVGIVHICLTNTIRPFKICDRLAYHSRIFNSMLHYPLHLFATDHPVFLSFD